MIAVRLLEKQMLIDYEDGVAVLKHRETWQDQMKSAKAALARLAEAGEEQARLANEAVERLDAYARRSDVVLGNIQNGNYDNARAADRVMQRAKDEMTVVEKNVEAIDALVAAHVAATEADITAAMGSVGMLFGAVVGIAAIVVVPLTLLNSRSASATSVARRGGQVVADVVTTMGAINISSLRIADIIGTVDGIAFQTNILALNAAVEAARAGEQGRGFAVVASEVRSLAHRSAEAAKEIKTLIQASVEKVESGLRQVQDAGRTMDEIVASVQRAGQVIAEISAAAAEQNGGIGELPAPEAKPAQTRLGPTARFTALVPISVSPRNSKATQHVPDFDLTPVHDIRRYLCHCAARHRWLRVCSQDQRRRDAGRLPTRRRRLSATGQGPERDLGAALGLCPVHRAGRLQPRGTGQGAGG